MPSSRPKFPSLYSPHVEIGPFHEAPNAIYLDDARDIYLFTLYWTFILYAPMFLITGVCASLFLALEPLRVVCTHAWYPDVRSGGKLPENARRRSIVYGLFVFMIYGAAGTLLSVLGSTVVGFLIAGVYLAGQFRVSTWVPFIWALLQTLVALTSTCSLVIDII